MIHRYLSMFAMILGDRLEHPVSLGLSAQPKSTVSIAEVVRNK